MKNFKSTFSSISNAAKTCFGMLCVMFTSLQGSAQFSAGNVVVMQIGNGVTTLTSSGNHITLNEYNPAGSLTYSVAIPSTGANAMVLRGNATSEGYMSKSSDGNYLVFGAYMQALPNTSALNSSAPSSISRGIALVDGAGTFTIGASSNVTSIASGDIRGAAASNNTNLWGTSSSQGASYYGTASTATNVENTKTNLRAAHIFNNQLYISSQVASGTPTDIGVYSVGTGTPNSSAQTVSTVINCGTSAQPGQFFFNSAGTICYVADARNTASGGIQKWVNSSSVWSLAYTLPTGTAAIGAFGVVADFSGTNPVIYATSTESALNRLIAIQDVGASSTATTLATASPSTIFRGIAFSPVTSTCVPPSIVTSTNNAPVCSSDNLIFNVTAAGTAPINYNWAGQGVFSSTSVPNPTVSGSASGAYTLTLSNSCGTTSTAITVSINPSPTIQVNAATICSGGVATITASGASTYTWNTNVTSASFTASPSSTTNYTVNGTSAAGCAASSVTTSINITTSPSLTVNSASICAGGSATLTASGASTYTWSSNSQTTGVIVVTPASTTNYTVSGNASGCVATIVATTAVVVNPLPSVTLTINGSTVCTNNSAVSLSGSPSGGTFSGTAVSGSAFSPTIAGVGTFTLTYKYTDANGCSNTDKKSISVISCVGIKQFVGNTDFRIYPNPVKDELHLNGNFGAGNSSLDIFDMSGKIVLSVNISNVDNSVHVDSLNPGIYFARIVNGDTMTSVKFVKE